MQFIGIDLAWSPRNPTGAAVIAGDERGGTLVNVRLLNDDEAIVAYVAQHANDRAAIVAVDAPLWVPNETGRRPSEVEIGKAFARSHAGAHPANRKRLAFGGVVRGEALVEALAQHDFIHKPFVVASISLHEGKPLRQVIEVYPHPAMVALFGLTHTLKYKAKANRSRAEIENAWRSYQSHLRDLSHADPPLHGQGELLAQDVSKLKGMALKNYEDQVDAVMCAYIALYAFRWGDARCRTFGTMEGGYMYTPVPQEMRGQGSGVRSETRSL